MSDGPEERALTVREAIARALWQQRLSAKDISAEVGVPEHAVAEHLEHLKRSAKAKGEVLVVDPPECTQCGFVFKGKLKRPSRCPRCKSERIHPPRFGLEPR